MKCTRCWTLNAEGDQFCYGCKQPLKGHARTVGQPVSDSGTPGWAYVFAVLCGAIPVVAIGGLIPCVLGFGGAGSCLQVARSHSIPVVLRVLMCLGITGGAWVLFLMLLALVMSASA